MQGVYNVLCEPDEKINENGVVKGLLLFESPW